MDAEEKGIRKIKEEFTKKIYDCFADIGYSVLQSNMV